MSNSNYLKEYFCLQLRITNRKLKEDIGLKPLFAYVLILGCYIGLSILLFNKTEYAQYIFIITALSFPIKFSETTRNEFLRLTFDTIRYRKIRIIENLLVTIPFLIFLFYKEMFIGSFCLIIISIFLGLNSFKTNLNYTIPTPFYKRPFEFIIGFRNSYIVFPIAYILTFISIQVDNLNLGAFSILIIFIIVFSFYSKSENEYFVWSFSLSPKSFLFEKIKTAILFTTNLCWPILLVLCYFFKEEITVILILYLVAIAFLITFLFAKYSAYPNEINIPEVILLTICVPFPPLILFIAPYFYFKALRKLQQFLT